MHAVMFTSSPPLIYWQPATLAVMHVVQNMRKAGVPACYTVDAGPNVHVLCPAAQHAEVAKQLLQLDGVIQVITAHPGGPAHLL